MIRRLIITAVFMFGLVVVAAAQTAAPAPVTSPSGAASMEDVQHLFHVLRIDKQIASMFTAIQDELNSMIPQIVDKLDAEQPLTPEEKDIISKHLKTQFSSIYSDMPIQQMLDNLTPIYQKHFTKSDIDGLATFYSGPIGQKFLDEQPAMMQEGMAANGPLFRKLMQDAMDRAKQESQSLADELRKSHEKSSKVSPAPEPATPKK